MELEDSRLLITGGAGFIGSHLSEQLLAAGNEVVILDNFANSEPGDVPNEAELVEGDVTDLAVVNEAIDSDIDGVFHLAARKSVNDEWPRQQFEENTAMTYNILKAMDHSDVSEIAFTSSSTVYGEAPRPTPEDYAPAEPISVYATSKIADESLLSTHAHTHGMRVWTFRFANIVGPRLRGAVIPDFVEKLRANPETLTILGNGRQEKSYMYIEDCLDAMSHIIEHTDQPVNTFNLGTRTTTSVNQIADIISDELGVDPKYEYTGGERGWTGDIPKMCLSIEKLTGLGWDVELESDQAVRKTTCELINEMSN
ncbi:NAD-dependent epimerase/dehydratase family protein [Halalkalicoccus jeotgali]|uniref:NAD-dependent epimerase/dehydratase n=1 Tax=Halalkalicoccus jeotgali (strain DSM 18796 / CECT 7217 / JCM 14584 / KCTC 4019 / B3) TaxID=795797 RepID=D8J6M5_HALJB|nr:NAD-dependent epimerase/dehydratase family protein [Halalkalicoccus jeotgali]ADJ13902.1 NAD-dependent epimerase/dehydratase [Halalkalicoccus jeotgali B3]ELY34053.1 NAD-dependent epimerase/dehydratase [Halalkalicoccus jeotgali B3]